MGLDLGAPAYRCETTQLSWPKCWPCSRRLQELYPVEVYGAVARETCLGVKARYRLVLEVGCHGQKQRLSIEIPRRWSETHEQVIVGRLFVFVPNGRGGFRADFIDRSRRKLQDLETRLS